MTNLRKLGFALRIVRERSGKTMGDVADALKVSVVRVSAIETGTERVSIDDAKRFADAVGANWASVLEATNACDRCRGTGRQPAVINTGEARR